jgi:hypothetical protein
MSKAAVEKRSNMVRAPLPAPTAPEKPKIRIAQSRLGPAPRKKKPAA